MSRLDAYRKIYAEVNGDLTQFLERRGALTPNEAKEYFATIQGEAVGKKVFESVVSTKVEAHMSKRFHVITLNATISDGFKERVFIAFKEYWCLSDLKWELQAINHREMLVLTSATGPENSELLRTSLSAMSDGLKAGYAEGLAASKTKPTKLQKLKDIYADVYGNHDRFLVRAERELGLTVNGAETYYTNISAALAHITPVR